MAEKAQTAVIQEAYVQGVSNRSVDDLVQSFGMSGISKSQVSRLCGEIDDKINSFLDRPLEGDWPYIWLDATYLKVREAGCIVSVAVTIATGVNTDGSREVLGMAIGPSEAETFWAEFLRSLARRWGESDASEDGCGLADLAADAEGVISALDLQRYVLVGHSMGGKVAQLMASRQPVGLAGLILVAPSPPSPMIMPAQAREMMAGAYASRAAVEASIDTMLTAKPLSAEDREQVIEDSLRGAPQAKAAWPRSTSLEDIAAQVEHIAVPTLVIAGALDRVDPPIRLRAELLPRIPQAVMHVLPGTGHLSMLESPDAVAGLIADFGNHWNMSAQ